MSRPYIVFAADGRRVVHVDGKSTEYVLVSVGRFHCREWAIHPPLPNDPADKDYWGIPDAIDAIEVHLKTADHAET